MARVSPGEFIRQVRVETSKVSWPTAKETRSATLLVILMTTILAVFFLGIDQILGRLVKALLGAL
ncbi:MAG: preprotein translocase subunit SecE [Sphingomonadaceae bacterium]|jgi:preprotein translocase subunit SecE|nr:preprotein translocase subunit SecE [Sphingomonadaceae bacterium]